MKLCCQGMLAICLTVLALLAVQARSDTDVSGLPFMDSSDRKVRKLHWDKYPLIQLRSELDVRPVVTPLEQAVLILKSPPPGYEPATTEEEWAPFFRDNLYHDFKMYHKKIKETGRRLSRRLLAGQIKRMLVPGIRGRIGIALIKKNKIYAYLPPQMDRLMRKRINANFERVARISERLNLDLPDTILIHNVYDLPICGAVRGCDVPVFSIYKRFNRQTNVSIDQDIAFPHMSHSFDRLMFFPWHKKDPRGLHRATMQNSMNENCVRMKLANLTATAEGARYLDVGFCRNRKKGLDMPPAFMRGCMGMSQHAKYKFLINANGHVASSRRGHIMQCNSVILEQRTIWIEYFWRSLLAGTHYLQYTPKTIIPLLQYYSRPNMDGELRRMANASQHFCAKYLTMEGKTRYAVRALHEYASLFGDLDEFVRQFRGLQPPTRWDFGGDTPGNSSRYPAGRIDMKRLLTALVRYKPKDSELLPT